MSVQNGRLKVAVLMGGISPERDVSLKSGLNVAEALTRAGFDVLPVDVTPENLTILDDDSIDVFFLVLHGTWGEDGRIQQILEQKNLCYTGSDAESSRLAFDKIASKEIFQRHGISVPGHIEVKSVTDTAGLKGRLAELGEDFVVKPVKQGSSIGVKIVKGSDAAIETAKETLNRFGDCMIEEFIPGREITVGIVTGKAMPIVEIKSKGRFYDYHAKYMEEATEYLLDTITDTRLTAKIQSDAVKCFNALGCRHLGRVDMILAGDGINYVLEVNTLPGFTAHSLLPMAAARAGMDAPRLCVRIIESAMRTLDTKVKTLGWT